MVRSTASHDPSLRVGAERGIWVVEFTGVLEPVFGGPGLMMPQFRVVDAVAGSVLTRFRWPRGCTRLRTTPLPATGAPRH